MRTRKPISNVGYLSDDYLIAKLDEAISENKISFWCFIRHFGDEDLKKDHVHVYVIPTGTLDTVSFSSKFVEIDPGNPLPLRMLQWQPSKFDDWWLYILHDPDYLEMKRMKRNYRYSQDLVHCSDMEQLEYMISMIDYGNIFSLNKIINAAQGQMSIAQAIKEGIIPQGQLNRYVNIFKAIKYDSRIMTDDERLNYKYKGDK